MDIKNRISELMAERKWSKYRLAQECGIYITTVNSWFNKKRYNPSISSIQSICDAFGISLVAFFSGIDESNLSAEQIDVLDKYNKIPKSRRKIVTDLMDILIEEEKNEDNERQ